MRHSGIFFLMIAVTMVLNCLHAPSVSDSGEDHPIAPQHATPVTVSDIDTRLSEGDSIAIVEFYSEKCPVCTSLIWVIDSLHAVFGDSVVVGANNTDSDTLWKKFSVMTVPTYVLFRSGVEVTRYSFVQNEPQVYEFLAGQITGLVEGTITPDTGDTGTPPDTATPANYLTLDETNFDSAVLRSGTTALVFFLYAGGAPCIKMDTVMRQIAPLFDGRAVIAKVHAWDESSLSDRYGISYVPQFLFFKDGYLHEEARRGGVVEKDSLIALLEALIAEPPLDKAVILDGTAFRDSIQVEGRVAMVEFFSPFCHTCNLMSGVVIALADTFHTRAMIAKVNILENDSLTTAAGISIIPTFIFFKNGEMYDWKTGELPFDELATAIRTGLDGSIGKRRVATPFQTRTY